MLIKSTRSAIVYKVVVEKYDHFFSFCVGTMPVWLTAHYKIGEVTRPAAAGCPLLAFETIKDAKLFAPTLLNGNGYAMLKCEAGGVQGIASVLWMLRLSSMTAAKLAEWWTTRSVTEHTVDVPRGTVACEWLKPIEIVRGGECV